MQKVVQFFHSTYRYKAMTQSNTLETGEMSALFRSEVSKRLSRDNKTVVLIAKKQRDQSLLHIHLFGSRMRTSEKIQFFRNLAMMTVANVPFVISLEVIAEQMKSRSVQKIVGKVSKEVTHGKSLAAAMEKFPKYFSNFLVENVRVGEITGTLSKSLERIADILEKEQETRRKIKSVIAYPVIVVIFMIIVLVGVAVFVLPQIAEIYNDFGVSLPLITQVVLDSTVYVMHNPFIVAGVIIGIILLFWFTYKTKQGRYVIHATFLKTPILGELLQHAELARFFRAQKALIESGISVVDAVEISRKTLKNDVYKEALRKVRPVLNHGIPLSEILEHYPKLFPLTAQRTVEVGEQAGQFREAFDHLALHYDRSLQHKIQMLSTVMEPVLMILIGIVVGALALLTFLPIYEIASFI